MQAPVPALEIRDLHCAYGGLRSVDGVSFSVAPGSVVALVGPNGAGKTTLLNAISGLVRLAGGRIFLDGVEVTGLAPAQRARLGLARSFQLVRLFEDLRVLANVQLGCAAAPRPGFLAALLHLPAHRRHERETAARAAALLGEVGLAELGSRPARALSHGQSRRVELARALMAAPRVMLLDEPCSGLHAGVIGELVPIVRGAAAQGAAVIIVEHNLSFVGKVADRVIVLDRGRLIADGAPEAVVRDARVIEAYLGGGRPGRLREAP